MLNSNMTSISTAIRTIKLSNFSKICVLYLNSSQFMRRYNIYFCSRLTHRSEESGLRLNYRRSDFPRPDGVLQGNLSDGRGRRHQLRRFLCSESNVSDHSKESEKKLPKIYTRTGDKGTSVTIAGDRRPKNDQIFEALGATDELSSHIGLAREFIQDTNLTTCNLQLEEIQCVLQDAGSNIATPRTLASKNQLEMTEFNGATVEMLETWIDEMTASLPPLRNFILPSGGKSSSTLHVARSVCRRAERSIAPLASSGEIDPAVARFINRLSDYLFTAARFVAQEEGKTETIYRRVKPKHKK